MFNLCSFESRAGRFNVVRVRARGRSAKGANLIMNNRGAREG